MALETWQQKQAEEILNELKELMQRNAFGELSLVLHSGVIKSWTFNESHHMRNQPPQTPLPGQYGRPNPPRYTAPMSPVASPNRQPIYSPKPPAPPQPPRKADELLTAEDRKKIYGQEEPKKIS
jgi:hypothetical protein